jgi:hypothetical protein
MTVAENLSLLSIFPDVDKDFFADNIHLRILEIILKE